MAAKTERLVLGVASGWAADRLAAALVRVQGSGESLRWKLEAHDTLEYSLKVKELILRCSGSGGQDVPLVCRLNVLLGELFARAALHVTEQSGVDIRNVDLVGIDGQTIQHLPQPTTITGITVRAALQLGDPAVIAERTGLTTVSQFRARDMAAGGHGAPLAAYADYLMFRSRTRGRIVISIGGVCGLTAIPASASLDRVVGLESGPGTQLIDGLVSRMTGGREWSDHEGRYARGGRILPDLLHRLMSHPYLERALPKSCDRDEFGWPMIDTLLREQGRASNEDLLATVTRFVAESIAQACRQYAMGEHIYEEGIAAGSGARNTFLMELLREAIPELRITLSEEYDLPPLAKKAVAMAILASETILGVPNSMPAITGATRRVVLGCIVPGGAT